MSFHNLIISHLVEVKQTMYEIILLHYFSNKLPENKIAAQRVGGGGRVAPLSTLPLNPPLYRRRQPRGGSEPGPPYFGHAKKEELTEPPHLPLAKVRIRHWEYRR